MFKISKNGSGYSDLYSFSGNDPSGDSLLHPFELLVGSDGALYGMSHWIGMPSAPGGNHAAVFKLNKDGSGLKVLRTFVTASEYGEWFDPGGPLIEGSDGALYGTMLIQNETNGTLFTVFRLARDGSDYRILNQHTGFRGCLLEGSDGMLYVAASAGGESRLGNVFRLRKDGSDYEMLHEFRNSVDGKYPVVLIEGTDGALYGATQSGGRYVDRWGEGGGTLFKLNKDGRDYKALHPFGDGSDGRSPSALVQGREGVLYGITDWIGTADGIGTAFRLNNDGTGYGVLHRFTGGKDGLLPVAGVVDGGDGALYGATSFGPGTVFRLGKDGITYTVVHQFEVNPEFNSWGLNGVIQASDGVFYGTSSRYSFETVGPGSVFRINADGTGYRILYTFEYDQSFCCGARPSRLIEGSDGALYGTTWGWAGDDVFRISKDGSSYAMLHRFEEGHAEPGVVEGKDGALYGTACCLYTGFPAIAFSYVYRVNRDGSGFSVVRALDGVTNSATAYGLIAASDGALYGTTTTLDGKNLGTIFRMEIDGNNYQVIRDFGPTTEVNGWKVLRSLLEGSDGALYGIRQSYEPWNDPPAIFKLNKDGTGYQVLFHPAPAPDSYPKLSPLTEGRDGFLYCGVAWIGSGSQRATAFRLRKDGTGYTELFAGFSFLGEFFGAGYGLVHGKDGAFYGTGGAGEREIVFRLWPPETPEISVSSHGQGTPGIDLRVSGASGSRYQLLRSTDLSGWTVISTFRMEPAGVYTYSDSAPPQPAAFYRAVWMP
ncbi:MAG: hypothetical protein HY674_17040 [Chloroflexi bacterium]|nr:hypothetical protein [Chloroflexota bacterium]